MNQNRTMSQIRDFAARFHELLLAGQPALRRSCSSPLRQDRIFNDLALELFALQFALNPPYQRICQARGLSPISLRHWTQIPAVPTAAFKEFDLTCLPADERACVFLSSGTTGRRPSRHFHSPESLAIYKASLLPWFRAHLIPESLLPAISKSQVMPLILAPPASRAPHSSLVFMLDAVRCDFAAPPSSFVGRLAEDDSWELDLTAALEALRRAATQSKPLLLLGTAFSFVQLLDLLAARSFRFQLPAGSRVMETGGYKGRSRVLSKSQLHDFIAERLGVENFRVICEYGMSELSSQAYDLVLDDAQAVTPSRLFAFPPWARAQIVSPETGTEVEEGRTGLIRVFDLANVFSVMAVETEDLGARRADGFDLLGRASLAEPRGCSLMSLDIAPPRVYSAP